MQVTFRLSIMFLETADCMALKGMVVPFSSETAVPAGAAGGGEGALAGAGLGGAEAPFEATAAWGGGGGGAATEPGACTLDADFVTRFTRLDCQTLFPILHVYETSASRKCQRLHAQVNPKLSRRSHWAQKTPIQKYIPRRRRRNIAYNLSICTDADTPSRCKAHLHCPCSSPHPGQ